MISTSQAEVLIREHMRTFPAVACPIDQAAGAILRQPIIAERDQPPYDRITMDGIAIAFGSFAAGRRRFPLAGMQAAGMEPSSLPHPDGCIEVMTGTVLPQGCDTVIPVEQTRREADTIALQPDCQPQQGQFIHRRGLDCRAGAALIAPGARLRATEMAIIASHGYASISVASSPRVTVLATGDELVDVDVRVANWQVRRSNDHALAAMLASHGMHDVELHHVSDERPALLATVERQLRQRDVLILSGGVSMGQRDHVPGVLQELGVRCIFHKIAQRPGKPMWFGVGPQGQAVFALPGNPVSAMVCGARYVMPALLQAMGAEAGAPVCARLASALDFPAPLAWFVPVRLQQDGDSRTVATPMPVPTSGDFSALTQTGGFIELPAAQQHFPAGFTARYYRW